MAAPVGHAPGVDPALALRVVAEQQDRRRREDDFLDLVRGDLVATVSGEPLTPKVTEKLYAR
jgi:hypothetical protein